MGEGVAAQMGLGVGLGLFDEKDHVICGALAQEATQVNNKKKRWCRLEFFSCRCIMIETQTLDFDTRFLTKEDMTLRLNALTQVST